MGNEKFGFEILTEGSFKDSGYNIRVIVIRLNPAAVNRYVMSGNLNCRGCYETKEEWEEYKARKEKERNAWERKILGMLGFSEDTGYSITRLVSEIFSVVLFEKG